MKEVIINSKGDNYTALEIGDLDELNNYSFQQPNNKHTIQGKLFLGKLLNTTGIEISFQELQANTSVPFLHSHKNNEEVYICIKGKGQFQIDSELIDIKEGSIIRVSKEGKRTWRNNSDKPLILIVIQAKANTLKDYFTADGFLVKGELLK